MKYAKILTISTLLLVALSSCGGGGGGSSGSSSLDNSTQINASSVVIPIASMTSNE